MKSKLIFSSGLFLLIVLFFFPQILFAGTQKPIGTKNGIYMGKFHNNAMFYESDSGRIKKIGLSFEIKKLIAIDNESFFSYISDNVLEKYIYCQILPITKDDYSKAIINSDSEFSGLLCGPLLIDPDYPEGLLLSIKNLPNGKFQIIIVDLREDEVIKAIGKICMVNKPIPHRKLSFEIKGGINSFTDDLWEITLNPITKYAWRGIFNVYINGILRFEIEAMDN